MIELVFWSFMVALLPIALSLGSRLLTSVAAPFSPPADRPFVLDRHFHPVHPYASQPIGRSGRIGHGR